jgi:hypothetical protein
MPSNPVANTRIAVATRYVTTCKNERSHSEAFREGCVTIYLAKIRQFICQTTSSVGIDERTFVQCIESGWPGLNPVMEVVGDVSKGKSEKELFGLEVGELQHEIELGREGAQAGAGIALRLGQGKELEAIVWGELWSAIEGLNLRIIQNL